MNILAESFVPKIYSAETGKLLYRSKTAVTDAMLVTEATLAKVDLSGAELPGVDLESIYLPGAELGGADLDGANLKNSFLAGARLFRARLAGANLGGAILGGAGLAHANLEGANLRGTFLGGADLSGASLKGARIGGATVAEGSGVAQATPLNRDGRGLIAVIAAPDKAHDKPWLCLCADVLGLMVGDEAHFRADMKLQLLSKSESRSYLAALDFVKAVAATWGVTGYRANKKRKAGK